MTYKNWSGRRRRLLAFLQTNLSASLSAFHSQLISLGFSTALGLTFSVLLITEHEVGFLQKNFRRFTYYDVDIGSRTRDAVTYSVVRILLKAVKTSHILRRYLSHIGRGSTSHDVMQSDVVILLLKFVNVQPLPTRSKKYRQKVDHS